MTETTTAPSQSKTSRPTSWLTHTIVAVQAVVFMLFFVSYDNSSLWRLLTVDHDRELRGKSDAERVKLMESQREEIKDRAHSRRMTSIIGVALLMGVNLALIQIRKSRLEQNAPQ